MDARLPTATTRPARTATASAQGRAGSAVKIRPPTMTRSAVSSRAVAGGSAHDGARTTAAARRTGRASRLKLVARLGARRTAAGLERAQVDLLRDQAPEVGGGQGADLVAGAHLDRLDRLLPDALAARDLVRVAQAPVLLHPAVVPAQHAERVERVGAPDVEAQDAHVV